MTLSPLYAEAPPSAEDFLGTPIAATDTTLAQPNDVKIEGDTVSAATPVDAAKSAVAKEQKDLGSGAVGSGIGAELLKFPSGMGVLASGMGTYRVMENSTATRISQKEAYVLAFTQAKKNMAEFLKGLSHEEKESIRQSLANVETDKESLTNIQTDTAESINQSLDMTLRGFAVFEVSDDPKKQTVYVSIVSTPKTCGALARIAPNAIVADDLHQGVTQVLNEVRSGIVPPVGGRIITIRATGENVFVGFGSEVARSNKNAAVQARLNLDVQQIAKKRAQGSLCGLISGDQTFWKGDFSSETHDASKEFEAATANDPTAPTETGVQKLDAQRQAFLAKMQNTDVYESARNGTLPPGVNIKTWFNEDNTWAFAMAVYIPSDSKLAAKAAADMENAHIVQPVEGNNSQSTNGFKDQNNPNVPRPGSEIKPGPTTRANPDDY